METESKTMNVCIMHYCMYACIHVNPRVLAVTKMQVHLHILGLEAILNWY